MTMVRLDMDMDTVVTASTFKAKCLALLDDVAESRSSIIVTKYGRPVARLVPIDEPAPMLGSVSLISDDDEAYFTTGARWDADSV